MFTFTVLIVIRSIPQYLIGSTPIGYDTSSAYILAYLNFNSGFFASLHNFSLLYYLFSLFHNFGFDALFILKVLGPILYTLLAGSFFLVLRDVFRIKAPLALYGIIIFALQITTLRFSWDLYRNELGLIFALLSIWQMALFAYNKRILFLLGAVLTFILTLGAHQLTGLLLVILLVITVIMRALGPKTQDASVMVPTCLIFLIGWLIAAHYISTGGVGLWYHFTPWSPHEYLLPIGLGILLFSPLVILSFIGMLTTWYPPLLLFTALLMEQSFSTVLFHSQGFNFWDRWMCFLIFPFTVYAILGIQWLGKTILKWSPIRYMAYCLFFVITLQPAIQYINPNLTLYQRPVDHSIFNFFPATMVANAFIENNYTRELSVTLQPCLQQWALENDGVSPLYIPSNYSGILTYYAPGLASRIQVEPSTLPTLSNFYIFSYTLNEDTHLTNTRGVNDTCHILYHNQS